jgi:outer membrane protein TolC
MDTKLLSEKVVKALALQEQIGALEAQVSTLKDKSATGKQQAEKLQTILRANSNVDTELAQTEAKLAQTQSALALYLKNLEDEGISLPLGKKQVVPGRL